MEKSRNIHTKGYLIGVPHAVTATPDMQFMSETHESDVSDFLDHVNEMTVGASCAATYDSRLLWRYGASDLLPEKFPLICLPIDT